MAMKRILVLGATGTQGIPAVRELVAAGFDVHGLTRPGSAKAQRLVELGAQVASGDLFDEASLEAAMEGMDGVLFIPPVATADDPIPELTVGLNVVRAAEAAGVGQLVHTSVDRAGDHEGFAGWGRGFGRNYRMYWLAKSGVIDLVKASAVPRWTVFKPAMLMESFLPPLAASAFPTLAKGLIATAIAPGTAVGMVSAEDQARLIALAFADPEAFDRREVPLAGDRLTMAEAAEAISAATGGAVRSESLTAEEFAANPDVASAFAEVFGEHAGAALAGTVEAHAWDSADGYTADVAESNSWGARLMTFPEWCARHAADFGIA